MKTYNSKVDFGHVAKVVHPSGQFVLVVFNPAVVARNAGAVLLAEEDVLQTGRSFDTTSAVVLTHPDKTEVLLEYRWISISQSYDVI